MPTIASYVGGTPTIADDGRVTEMYRFEEFEMLAQKIIRVFNEGADIERIKSARDVSFKRHNGEKNVFELERIYKSINCF